RLPVLRILHIRSDVEVVLRQPAEVGDARDVRPFAGRQLHGELLDDRLVRDLVDRDLDVGVLRLEALREVLRHLAFVAVGIAGDSNSARGRDTEDERRRQARQRSTPGISMHDFLLATPSRGARSSADYSGPSGSINRASRTARAWPWAA